MVRIKDDGGTHTKCLLDPFDTEASQLEATARDTDWEREIAVQLMARCGLRAGDILARRERRGFPRMGNTSLVNRWQWVLTLRSYRASSALIGSARSESWHCHKYAHSVRCHRLPLSLVGSHPTDQASRLCLSPR